MTQERNMKHPNFFLGLASYIILIVGVVMLATDLTLGRQLVAASLIAGGIHWAVSIINVCTDPYLKGQESRYFWLALIIMVPPMAGMIYYMTDGKRFSY